MIKKFVEFLADVKKEFNVCRIGELDRLIGFKTFSSLKALSILN